MTTERYSQYRGDIRAAVGVGNQVAFVTVHPEGQPTALYRWHAEKQTLDAALLPAGGVALVADGEHLWVGGSDARIYHATAKNAPKSIGAQLAAAPVALALLAQERLAALVENTVVIVNRGDGKTVQTLPLPDAGTALATDPTGQWLVAGTARGHVTVFDGEGKPEFLISESEKIHEGAVTALLFEQEELRFFSVGADQKLLSTHARGKLEPEDRGRGNNHTEPITAMIWAPGGERFYTGSRDKTVKAWPRVGAAKPATLKDGVVKVTGLTLVQVHTRTQLAVVCDDNTLRCFIIDAAGKIGDPTAKVYDAFAWVKNEFEQTESRRREAAIRALAGFNDNAGIELLSEQIGKDGDHGLRLLATQLLGDAANPRAAKALEKRLNHADEAVRIAALTGLRKHLGDSDLRPLDLALKTDKPDVGKLAVAALEQLAAKDDQALTRLVETLDAKTLEVRRAALASLERVHGGAAEANLIALNSKHADLRKFTLIRLFQRKLLQDAKVQAALRRRAEDADADVRRTAFLISLCTRDRLPPALRARDPELHRQLVELETFGQEAEPEGKEKKGKKTEKAEPALQKVAAQVKAVAGKPQKPAAEKPNLDEADYNPLLQATASRALDVCLMGGRGLAVLGDPRAFGLLLQLSREDDTAARVEVCRALAALDDERAVKRLRSLLYDKEAAVRDAAFTALLALHDEQPLTVAESGLSAAFEDVRRRGLQVLVSEAKKAKPKDAVAPTWQLLVRALNDSFESVRNEAFKAALNLQIAGGGVATLRFVLQSAHANVRREVLTEVMAQVGEQWAWSLLLEFYNDPDPKLRDEAFQFAVKKTKELEPLEVGLLAQYVDVRKAAVEGLVKKHTKAAQAILVRALVDKEKVVRQRAIQSLVSDDARAALTDALQSPHDDVRLSAAKALAKHGDRAALPVLLSLATRPEPQEKERQGEWAALVADALAGLAELGDPAALTDVLPLLDSTHANVRQAAARALIWVSPANAPEALRQALQHNDNHVKYLAALGLAYAGDPYVASWVFVDQAATVFRPEERLIAALTLGPAGEDQLTVFLDDADSHLCNQALLLLMMLELKANAGTPTRCLASLSSRMPRVRLTAARALECFTDPAAFLQFVTQLFNDRGEEQPWKIGADIVDTVATLVAHAGPHLKARTAALLQTLKEKEPHAWNAAWAAHTQRFAHEIATLRQQAQRPPASQYTPEQLQELAFGAYVGLVREQGSAAGRQERAALVIRVRQTALARILALAGADAHYARAAVPVFVQALGDPNQPVRFQAFEQLQTLKMDGTALGAEALEAGHTDLGIKGLELLGASAKGGQGDKVIEQVMLTRGDNLALEAAKLLVARQGQTPVAARALEAANDEVRKQAVLWLAAEYEKDPAAQAALRQALDSRYRPVRNRAALELAGKKDSAAYAALVSLLNTAPDAATQNQAIKALVTLGDPRTPDALLDRLENDPAGTAQVAELFQAVGRFRRPEVAPRLFGLFEKQPKWRKQAFEALQLVSGHDQPIEDYEDEKPDREWLEKQHPRRDALLAQLIDRCFTVGAGDLLTRLIPAARWALGQEVDSALAVVVAHPDERFRHSFVEAVGWRLRKRGGPAESLVKALAHKDPVTQFLAAEGLAKAGRNDGMNVLLASIDFLTDHPMRARALRALGELADVRSVDTLLRLANEEGHALQDVAAEAIGHLGRSDKADAIFKLLARLVKSDSVLAGSAVKGLRWLNTRDAWQLIREQTQDWATYAVYFAIEQLGYNNEPSTRDLLLKMLSESDDTMSVEAALTSARRLWGPDALEPDYALLRNPNEGNDYDEVLKRACERGEPAELFRLLASGIEFVHTAIANALINRTPPPLAEARAALTSQNAKTVQVAAHLLGRAGSAAKDAAKDVAAALDRWAAAWQERRRLVAKDNLPRDRQQLDQLTPCLTSLIWAAGRLGVAQDRLVALAAAGADDPLYRPIRLEAVTALADSKDAATLDVLEQAALGNDPEIRTVAADALGRNSPERAKKIAEKLLSDRVSFNRLLLRDGAAETDTLRAAVRQVHYQGVALPHLVAQADVDGLAAVAENPKLPEATRLGAVEGLAKIPQAAAEQKLLAVARNDKEEEELRKAAWRALRRLKRARQRLATAAGEVKTT